MGKKYYLEHMILAFIKGKMEAATEIKNQNKDSKNSVNF